MRLRRDFFYRPTETVARELLGKQLTRTLNGKTVSGIIVETEAYLGLTDKAAHSFGGKRTARSSLLYQPGGYSYVYLIYGMHYCFNVVCGDTDLPEAVLIRALEPTEGVALMQKRRGQSQRQNLANGPGKIMRRASNNQERKRS